MVILLNLPGAGLALLRLRSMRLSTAVLHETKEGAPVALNRAVDFLQPRYANAL